jgi:putative ABC transport system permease protein
MGMKKGKVALGTAMEMFIITGFCLVIALTAASFAAQPVADSLLADQIAVAEQSETDSGGLIPGSIFVINGSTTEDAVEPLSELDVSITPSAIAQISLVALVIAALSSAVGTAYVMRFEPMRILSERN